MCTLRTFFFVCRKISAIVLEEEWTPLHVSLFELTQKLVCSWTVFATVEQAIGKNKTFRLWPQFQYVHWLVFTLVIIANLLNFLEKILMRAKIFPQWNNETNKCDSTQTILKRNCRRKTFRCLPPLLQHNFPSFQCWTLLSFRCVNVFMIKRSVMSKNCCGSC